jgi:hypothetical protein
MKTILDKINKADEIQAKKVELGKHEVELALTDDIAKKTDQIQLITNALNKFATEFRDQLYKFEDLTKEINQKNEVITNNKTLAQKVEKESNDIYIKALDAAKLLGVNKTEIKGLVEFEKAKIAMQDAIKYASKIQQAF